jgi:leader peptidase (prepilin peptidase)/N-methyltransferase
MLRILATLFAALFGLAFGSFLNVCLSRWPHGESIVYPHSHCRTCDRPLKWWENIPVLSWLALRGRCRTCRALIGLRYMLVEASIAILWATCAWRSFPALLDPSATLSFSPAFLLSGFALATLLWLLVALAVLDTENLWLPDFLTLPGIAVGLVFRTAEKILSNHYFHFPPLGVVLLNVEYIVAAAAIILLIRGLYWLIRRREGIGLGDAKLMAMLAAWLGLPGALLAFFFGVIIGALFAIHVLNASNAKHTGSVAKQAGALKLPFGTFLCIGGIISALWGQPILTTYLVWAGF